MKPYRPIKSNFIQYIRNCGWSACAKDTYKISCRSVSSIESFASKIASVAEIGDVILLSGDMGAGKTCFARGFIRHINSDADIVVTSPSYLLDNTYNCQAKNCTIHHMDLYRLPHGTDMSLLGIPNIFSSCISLIEWPDRLEKHFRHSHSSDSETANGSLAHTTACIEIEFKISADQSRQLWLSAYGTFQSRLRNMDGDFV